MSMWVQVSELERCHGDIASGCLAKIHPHFALLRDLDIRFYDNANNVAATILDKYSQVRVSPAPSDAKHFITSCKCLDALRRLVHRVISRTSTNLSMAAEGSLMSSVHLQKASNEQMARQRRHSFPEHDHFVGPESRLVASGSHRSRIQGSGMFLIIDAARKGDKNRPACEGLAIMIQFISEGLQVHIIFPGWGHP